MANWREPDRTRPGRRYPAMGLVMVLVFVAFWYLWEARLSGKEKGDQVADVSPVEFVDVLKQGKPGILEFYTTTCPWCEKIEGELAQVSRVHGKQVFVVKMNAERYWSEASKYQISGVPALILFDSKGMPTAIASGYREFDEIVEILKDYKFIE